MKAFFTQWDGRDMKEQSSRRLMKQFFKNLRCVAAEITCNTTRRNVAHIENQKSVAIRDRMRVLMNEAANPDLAVLQSHHTWSQRELYVEEYQQCCVFGYLTLRSYANTQARRPEMVERLAEVERMLSRLRNVPERRADAHEARRSTPSPQIQDIAEGDLVDIQEEVDIGEESDAGDADDEISYDDNAGDETADHRHLSEDDDARPSGADVLLPLRTRRKRDSKQAMLSGDDELIDIIRYSPAPPQTPVGPSAPIFLKELRHQPLKPSEVMVMEARVAGVPHPQVEWLKNGKPFQNYLAKIEHDPQTGIVSLTISQMFNDDVGEYTCRASNIHGEIFFRSAAHPRAIRSMVC